MNSEIASENDKTEENASTLAGRNAIAAKILAGHYTKEKRIQETICVLLSISLMLYNFICLVWYFDSSQAHVILPYAFLGILTADFVSGIVHWFADSYGSVEMPLFGRTLIRSFREHHVDPTSICRHDFIETNGDNFAVTLLPLAVMGYRFMVWPKQLVLFHYNWFCYVFLLTFFVSLTNQIHKWSHTHFGLPWYIELLQRLHIILPKKEHHIHHIIPHDTFFCITTGWLNYPFEFIDFWDKFERGITLFTGIQPRTDDMKWLKKM